MEDQKPKLCSGIVAEAISSEESNGEDSDAWLQVQEKTKQNESNYALSFWRIEGLPSDWLKLLLGQFLIGFSRSDWTFSNGTEFENSH